MADVRGVWHGTDFASSLQHFIFLRRAKFHGFKRTLTFSHAKATTKGPLELSIRFGLFVHFLDETGLSCIEDMRGRLTIILSYNTFLILMLYFPKIQI